MVERKDNFVTRWVLPLLFVGGVAVIVVIGCLFESLLP